MALNIIGHRGNGRTTKTAIIDSTKATENSIASLRQAIVESGADGVEFDVYMSKDNVPILGTDNVAKGGSLSDMTLAFIEASRTADHENPTLEEALDALAEASLEENRKIIINLELKGEGVVAPALDLVKRAREKYGKEFANIIFSSADRNKLVELRKLTKEERIYPIYISADFFDKGDIELPGYHVDPAAAYNRSSLADISRYVKKYNCSGIDLISSDVREPLIDFADEHDIGFCSYPGGPRLVDHIALYGNSLRLLKQYGDGHDVSIKADNVKAARVLFGDSDLGGFDLTPDAIRNSASDDVAEKLARYEGMMGNNFVEPSLR